MKASDVAAGVAHIIVEIIEYIPNSIVSKTILNKSNGHVSVMSFDSGEGLLEKTSPFDTFLNGLISDIHLLHCACHALYIIPHEP